MTVRTVSGGHLAAPTPLQRRNIGIYGREVALAMEVTRPWSFIRVPVRARSCASIPKPICAVARFSGITGAWKTLSSVVCSGRWGWDDGCESTTMNLMQQVRDVRQCPQHPSAHAHKFTHKFAHEFALLEMLNAPSRVLLVPF